MPTLYRAMKDDGEDMPLCGPTARTLGVRLEVDILIAEDGEVEPETGGMSVAIDTPMNLPEWRRPAELEGIGDDPVWQIEEEELPDLLAFRRDPRNPSTHGFVEPAETMRLDDYQEALATSRSQWRRI